MEVGSIVATVKDFAKLGRTWNITYPPLHSALTIAKIEEHPCEDVRVKGIKLLFFEEYPNLHGICDRDIKGRDNFVECKLPEFVNEILKN